MKINLKKRLEGEKRADKKYLNYFICKQIKTNKIKIKNSEIGFFKIDYYLFK